MTQTDILGKLGGGQGQQGGITAVTQLFGGNGIQGITAALQTNGLTNEVQSWIQNGRNLPVVGADIKRAIDPRRLAQMAKRQGVTPDALCEQIAQVLPGLVDKATPNGRVPKQAGVTPLTDIESHQAG